MTWSGIRRFAVFAVGAITMIAFAFDFVSMDVYARRPESVGGRVVATLAVTAFVMFVVWRLLGGRRTNADGDTDGYQNDGDWGSDGGGGGDE